MPLPPVHGIFPGTRENTKTDLSHKTEISHCNQCPISPKLVPNLLGTSPTSTGITPTNQLCTRPVDQIALVQFLSKTKLSLKIEGLWRPTPLRKHDIPIMQLFIKNQSRSTLKDLNSVRMFMKISMLSEITTSDGKYLSSNWKSSSPPFHQQYIIPPNWLNQPMPSRRA